MQLGVDWSSLEGNQPVMTSFMSYWRPCPCGVCALLGTPHSCLCRTRSRISALGSWQCGMGLTSPPGSWVLGSVADSCPSLWTDRQLLDELWVSRVHPWSSWGSPFCCGQERASQGGPAAVTTADDDSGTFLTCQHNTVCFASTT
jgi:hypothetical protein